MFLKTSETDWQVTRRRIPQERSPQTHRGEKLQTRMLPKVCRNSMALKQTLCLNATNKTTTSPCKKVFRKLRRRSAVCLRGSRQGLKTMTPRYNTKPRCSRELCIHVSGLHQNYPLCRYVLTPNTPSSVNRISSVSITLQKELIHTALLPGPRSKLKIDWKHM